MMNVKRLSELRVLIAHDWLVSWGGAERCVEQMLAVLPQADVVVAVRGPQVASLGTAMARRARESWLGRLPCARTHFRWMVPLEALAFATLDAQGYDLVVSSSHSFAKAIAAPRGATHVSYCYSPPRYLWDQRRQYGRYATRVQRVALSAGTLALRRLDLWAARRVDHFVAISSLVADRIRRTYARTSRIVYPPVEGAGTAPRRQRGDYVLYLGRLVPYKRVDLAIEASRRLGVRLLVAGAGPERGRLEAMAGPNVAFLGWVSDAEGQRLLAECRAFVFCAEEDFGIAPVEANAHGAPVVGYGKGGLAETMVDGVTSVLFREQTADAVTGALESALGRHWDQEAMVANAARFSPSHFRAGFAAALEAALNGQDGGASGAPVCTPTRA